VKLAVVEEPLLEPPARLASLVETAEDQVAELAAAVLELPALEELEEREAVAGVRSLATSVLF
jgi:hypothetical protein